MAQVAKAGFGSSAKNPNYEWIVPDTAKVGDIFKATAFNEKAQKEVSTMVRITEIPVVPTYAPLKNVDGSGYTYRTNRFNSALGKMVDSVTGGDGAKGEMQKGWSVTKNGNAVFLGNESNDGVSLRTGRQISSNISGNIRKNIRDYLEYDFAGGFSTKYLKFLQDNTSLEGFADSLTDLKRMNAETASAFGGEYLGYSDFLEELVDRYV